MTRIDFASFYEAVHSRPPFPWQKRLAEQVITEGWPRAITIPTGCGKTSVIDVAVYVLAAQAGSPQRTAPLRIFFVIDRRLVVDDVYGHACGLAEAISQSESSGSSAALRWVAEQLLKFGAPQPLEVAVLRGGMYRSSTWVDAPNQPLVCVSTVDQVGSRLLFRGYGLSEARRPVDAGLVGNDSLIILDEAHVSQPFVQTLQSVERYQADAWRKARTAPGVRLVQMSATLEDGFGLGEEDFLCEDLRRRLDAHKTTELKEVSSIPDAAAGEAHRLAEEGAGVVGIVLNTVGAAREAFERLDGEKVLLTGRVRPRDRDRLLTTFLERMRPGRVRRDGERLFVVATQTVEVGADLDFDALVTEAAPIDALRQRFGRLDRLGTVGRTRAFILKSKRARDKDWVYGGLADAAWEWLRKQEAPIDFGLRGLTSWPAELNARRDDAPLMFPAHVDAWAQTNPAPTADPDVAPFLHGSRAPDNADVQIVWRADLDGSGDWQQIVEATPPLTTEALPVPIAVARRWLARQESSMADLEGVAADSAESRSGEERKFLIWRGPDKWVQSRITQIRPGDTIVVPSSTGGCDDFGWNPASTDFVPDIGDICANERAEKGGGRFRVRLHPLVLYPEPEQEESRDRLKGLLERAAADDDVATAELRTLAGERFLRARARTYGAGDALLLEAPRVQRERAAESDDPDDDESSFTRGVSLAAHTGGVVAKARLFATACGANGATPAIVAAAERHDLGKCDQRFQEILGNWQPEPKAKGDNCSLVELRRRCRESGYPKGARHEFASAALAEAFGEWPEGCDRELALYLIGTHHGHGRPFPPVWEDSEEISAAIGGRQVTVRNVADIGTIDSGWADRYWSLTRKYGWWGLAYLEAILRRADCVESREEESK